MGAAIWPTGATAKCHKNAPENIIAINNLAIKLCMYEITIGAFIINN